MRAATFAVMLAARLWAGEISGPTLGLVHDQQTGDIRPVLGTPGASSFGESIAGGLREARTAGGILLGISAEDGIARLITPGDETVREFGPADRIALSPRGLSAALWVRETGRIQVWRAGEPVSEFFAGTDQISALAASDDGSSVIAVSSAGLTVFSREHGGVRLGPGQSAAFFPDSGEAVLALADSVVRMDSAGEITPLFEMRAAAVGAAKGKAIAASGDGDIAVFDLAGGGAREIARCECTPTMAEPMADGSTFRLTGRTDQPVWLLDAAGPAPRVVFIPAAGGIHHE